MGGARSRRARNTSRSPTASTTSQAEFTRARRLHHRSAGRHGAVRPGLPPRRLAAPRRKSSPAAGRCASRWPNCCSKSPICCCSTSRPTTSIWKRATGWKSISADYPNAFVLISHDRYFLDVTVSKIAEIWNKRVYFYTGDYSKYEPQKTERRAQLEAAYSQSARAHRSSWKRSSTASARRRPRPSRCRAASRNWRRSSASRFRPTRRPSTSRFPQPKPSGRIVAEFQNVSKSYGEKHVFGGANFIIERGDRIALVGVNGAGKSTLIKLLSGDGAGLLRRIQAGPQRRAGLLRAGSVQGARPESRACSTIWVSVAPRADATPNCAACWAASCSPKTMCSSASACSRAASATAMRWRACCCMPGNFLLLDEPTNHLDMRAKDVLLTALQEFTGTVVFVSHDRYFIDKLATRVFEVGDGEVHVFPGNYEDYRLAQERGARPTPVPSAKAATSRRRSPEPQAAAASKRRLRARRSGQRRQAAPAQSHQAAPDERSAARHRRRDHAARSGDRRFRTALSNLSERAAEHRNRRAAGIPPRRHEET